VEDDPLALPFRPIRGLTDPERALLAELAVDTIARQVPHDPETVRSVLDELAQEGRVALVGDERDVYVVVAGCQIVHAARDWLRWAAYLPDPSLN
jgi:hypothetical protein